MKAPVGVTESSKSRLGKTLHRCTHLPKLKTAHLKSVHFTVTHISIEHRENIHIEEYVLRIMEKRVQALSGLSITLSWEIIKSNMNNLQLGKLGKYSLL